MIPLEPFQPRLTIKHPRIPGVAVEVQRLGRLYAARWAHRFGVRTMPVEVFELWLELLNAAVVGVVGIGDPSGPLTFGPETRDAILSRFFDHDLDVKPGAEAEPPLTFAAFICESILDRVVFGDAFSRSKERKAAKKRDKKETPS